MPRNSSGTMTLPSPGVPFQSGQTISSAQVNTTLSDIATEISDSASRSGKGNFTAPVRVPDGSAAAPAVAFGGEINSGVWRAGANDVRLAVGGVDALKLASSGATLTATGTNTSAALQGNRSAADAGGDAIIGGAVTRTAGYLAIIQSGGVNKLAIDYQGLLQLWSYGTQVQPASYVVTLTPDTGLTAGAGLGYWKNANGEVRIRGTLLNATGAAVSNLVTTAPLPAGFRPSSIRRFVVSSASLFYAVDVTATGTIVVSAGTIPNGTTLYLDGISFLAEA